MRVLRVRHLNGPIPCAILVSGYPDLPKLC